MNVIDKLVVELGLDNTKFKKGIKEADKLQDEHEHKTTVLDKKRLEAERKAEREHQKQHKEQQHRYRETLEGLRKFREETIGLLLIFTAGKGIIDFIGDTIRATAAIGHLSDNVQMGVGDIAGLQYAFKEIGGTAEGASAAIDKAATAVGDFRIGVSNKDVQGLFTAAGGTGVNLNGAFKDTKSFLLAQADVAHALYERDPVTAMVKARQMMGLDPETFNLLKEGRQHLLERMALGDKLSGVTKAQADASQRALKQWTAIETKLSAIGRTVLFALMPAFDQFSKWLDTHSKDVTKWVDKFAEGIKSIDSDKLNNVGKTLEGIATALSTIAELGQGLGIIVGAVSTGTNIRDTQYAGLAMNNPNWGAPPSTTHTTNKNNTNTFNIIGNPDPYSVVHAIDKMLGRQSNTGQ